MLGADVDLLVEAALLLDLPVRGHEGRQLGQLLHLLGRELGSSIRASLEVSDDRLLLERGQDLLDSQDIGNLVEIGITSLYLGSTNMHHLADIFLRPFQQIFLRLLLLVPDLILGELRELAHELLRELKSSDNLRKTR